MCVRPRFVCSGALSPWDECFIFGRWITLPEGFQPSAAVAREAVADLFYPDCSKGRRSSRCRRQGLPLGEPRLHRPLPHGHRLGRSWISPIAKHVKETFITGIADNTGAMWYYTLVNLQNQYKGDEKLAAKLPKKVMEPEDWPLDPEFEKKTLRNVSQYMLSGENGPTFAALCDDNPRARGDTRLPLRRAGQADEPQQRPHAGHRGGPARRLEPAPEEAVWGHAQFPCHGSIAARKRLSRGAQGGLRCCRTWGRARDRPWRSAWRPIGRRSTRSGATPGNLPSATAAAARRPN